MNVRKVIDELNEVLQNNGLELIDVLLDNSFTTIKLTVEEKPKKYYFRAKSKGVKEFINYINIANNEKWSLFTNVENGKYKTKFTILNFEELQDRLDINIPYYKEEVEND